MKGKDDREGLSREEELVAGPWSSCSQFTCGSPDDCAHEVVTLEDTEPFELDEPANLAPALVGRDVQAFERGRGDDEVGGREKGANERAEKEGDEGDDEDSREGEGDGGGVGAGGEEGSQGRRWDELIAARSNGRGPRKGHGLRVRRGGRGRESTEVEEVQKGRARIGELSLGQRYKSLTEGQSKVSVRYVERAKDRRRELTFSDSASAPPVSSAGTPSLASGIASSGAI